VLTPVIEKNNIYYKRDDLFSPYGDVNGGKVRQAIALFERYKDKWPGVIASVSVHSPTGPVISRVAKAFNKPCIIAIGGTKPELLDKLPMMKLAKHFGAEVRIVAGHGMKTAINARVNEICKQNDYHNIDYSHHISYDNELMFDTNAQQVENIPDEIDTLVMSCGVGIQFSCVLKGLKKFNKKVKKIIGLGVGPDRTKMIRGYFDIDFKPEFEFIPVKTAYSKPCVQKVDDFLLDDLYEAKAHKWMLENLDLKQKILFWCVGRRLLKDEVESICSR